MSVDESKESSDSTFFRLKVDNILEINEEDGERTEEQIINGLPVEMVVRREQKYDEDVWELTGELYGMPEDFRSNFFFNFDIDFKLKNFMDDSKSKLVSDGGRIAEGYCSNNIHLIDWDELTNKNNGFIRNGAIILEGTVRPGRSKIHSLPSFDFFEPSEISDVTLIVERAKLHVSKQILAHHSSYFKCLFYGNFKESKESEIELKDVAYKDFEKLLQLFFGDKSQMEHWADAKKLLPLLDRFDCEGLKYEVQVWMMRHTNPYKTRIAVASEYRLNYLLDHCLSKMDTPTKIRTLMKTNEYHHFTNDIKEELQKKLKSLQGRVSGPRGRLTGQAVIPDMPSPNFDFTAHSEISDVVFVVEGQKVYVSSQILAHHSSYFKTLLFGNLKKFNDEEIEMDDLAHEDFLILLNLIYADKKQLIWSHMNQLLQLLNRFDCEGLKYDAQVWMIGKSETPLKTKIALACEHGLHFLLDDCLAGLDDSSEIRELMKSELFGKLTEDIKEELQKKMEKLEKSEREWEMQWAKRARL